MFDKLTHSLASTAGLTTYRIGLLQTKAYRILNQETARVLKKYNLTPVDWALLGLILESRGGLRLSELADQLGVEAPFITERTQILIKQKVVVISPSTTDKRVKFIELTAQSKQRMPEIERSLIKAMKPLLQGASIKDILGYKRVLDQIVSYKPRK